LAKAPFNLSFIPFPQLKQGAIEDAGRIVGFGNGNLIGDFQWDCAFSLVEKLVGLAIFWSPILG
jgi:hypothetical protein